MSTAMADPDATRADEVGGDLVSGDFTVLDTAPPGSEDVAGQAWLAQSDDGTTVTISLTGLAPETVYLAHLHAQTCASDNGGPHFQFDPEGSDVPPNEVHLAFTSSDDGSGEVTVTNDQQVGDGARRSSSTPPTRWTTDSRAPTSPDGGVAARDAHPAPADDHVGPGPRRPRRRLTRTG